MFVVIKQCCHQTLLSPNMLHCCHQAVSPSSSAAIKQCCHQACLSRTNAALKNVCHETMLSSNNAVIRHCCHQALLSPNMLHCCYPAVLSSNLQTMLSSNIVVIQFCCHQTCCIVVIKQRSHQTLLTMIFPCDVSLRCFSAMFLSCLLPSIIATPDDSHAWQQKCLVAAEMFNGR